MSAEYIICHGDAEEESIRTLHMEIDRNTIR